MAITVGRMDSYSSIGRFSITIFCRNYSQVDAEVWESSLWIRCTLYGVHIVLVIYVRKGARPDYISLRFVDILTELDRGDRTN